MGHYTSCYFKNKYGVIVRKKIRRVKNRKKDRPRPYYNKKLESKIVMDKRGLNFAPCVYALIKDDEVVYIGQSYNIMARLTDHINSNKVFDSYAIVEWCENKSSDYVLDVEKKYIKELRPIYNVKHNF